MATKELDVPFVASGGCATGEHLAAALAIGAEGAVDWSCMRPLCD